MLANTIKTYARHCARQPALLGMSVGLISNLRTSAPSHTKAEEPSSAPVEPERKLLKIRLPAVFPDMTEATLTQWHIKEGDRFVNGDKLFEIETDIAKLVVDADDDGILQKILVPAGTEGVEVNKVVAIMAEALQEKAPKKEEKKEEKSGASDNQS
eukprot:Colp12_sorted_trinity150504_noHs@30774